MNTARDIVWGVDVSTKAIAIASLPDGVTRTFTVASPPSVRRLGVAYRRIYSYVRTLANSEPPIAVWIEQPMGRHPSPSLVNMAGVAAAAIYNALHDHYGVECPTFFLNVKEWKKLTLGDGNASKAQGRIWAEHNYPQRKVRTEDECDALAIGYAGMSMMTPSGTQTDAARAA